MFTAFYIIIDFLSYLLPKKLAYFIDKLIVAAVYYSVYRKGRKNVAQNLACVFGNELEVWRKEKIIRETFINFGLQMYEFLIMRKMNRGDFKAYANPVGFEKVQNALKRGKGVIILTGHIGNYEWGAAMVAHLGYEPSVVVARFKNEYVTRYYYNRRVQQGLEVIYLEDAVRKTLRKMKKNGIVCIVGDRDYTNDGVEVEFFGKKTKFPAGAILMGLRTGAAVIPAFAVRVGICKYDVIFEDPLELKSKGYKQDEMKEDLMKWVKVMEKYVRTYPTQWYRFKPFWEPEME